MCAARPQHNADTHVTRWPCGSEKLPAVRPAVVPAHSASKTRVNALMLGTHIPETVVMGPRFRGDDNP
jgi:hypothetical protein